MNKKYYVICPSNGVTGGPDALHQMVYYLKSIGKTAEIAYSDIYSNNIAIPAPYKVYTQSFVTVFDINDSEDTVIICAETHIHYTKRFKKARVYIWWLSVDNNFKGTSIKTKLSFVLLLPFRFLYHPVQYCKFGREIIRNRLFKCRYNFRKERQNISHICASYYAYDYVSKRSRKEVKLCIEPISLIFLDKYAEWSGECQREDIVLYNPKKSGKQVDLLAKYDETIKFVPLSGYDQKGLIDMYKKAKLFVDFGPFPGAERMPKEAVLFGCAVITSRRGASAFYNDVPIQEEYKFDTIEGQKAIICNKIRYCLRCYSTVIADFSVYKNTVLNLENNFIKSLSSIFN